MSAEADATPRATDHQSLTVIDLPRAMAAHGPRFIQTLTTVNDAVVRLAIIAGEDFVWHAHDDQFFLVLAGELLIDFENRDTVRLVQHHGFTVPKGMVHRTRAPEGASLLIVQHKETQAQ